MGMISVRECTSADEVRAAALAAAERRKRLYGKPSLPETMRSAERVAEPVPVKAVQFASDVILEALSEEEQLLQEPASGVLAWRNLPFERKCRVFREHYRKGDTYRDIARRIGEFTRYEPTASALNGVYKRGKATFLTGITFERKGGAAWSALGRGLETRGRKTPTSDECKAAIGIAEEAGRLRVGALIEEMCKCYNIPLTLIIRHCNEVHLSLLRHKMMWVAKRLSGRSFPDLGEKFCRDHTTVIYGVKRIDRLIASNDPSVADLKGWLE